MFLLASADFADKNKVHAVIFGIIMKDKKISNELAQLCTGGDYKSPAVGYPVEKVFEDKPWKKYHTVWELAH